MTQAKLDASLREAVETGTPLKVVDPSTRQVYYLVSALQFEKMSAKDFDPREGYPEIEKVMAEDDACDPLLESYQ